MISRRAGARHRARHLPCLIGWDRFSLRPAWKKGSMGGMNSRGSCLCGRACAPMLLAAGRASRYGNTFLRFNSIFLP